MTLPRLLIVMGSGETSPTMVKTHREVFDRLASSAGGSGAPAVLLDTPYGFQANADDISARAVDYFARSVGRQIEVASLRRAEGLDPVAREVALARIRQAVWVFAGPGSPTYTSRQWAGSEVPDLLADKLNHGGAVTFASAAALTLGAFTVPVYEIYKVGEDPCWAPGLDLLRPAGVPVAVIPHYDNAEGGNHDTRFCYLGERRLALLETQLPEEAFVLGVDEHTGCLFDLDRSTVTVVGLGGVTLRYRGRSTVLPTGSTMAIDELPALARHQGGGSTLAPDDGGGVTLARDDGSGSAPPAPLPGTNPEPRGRAATPLLGIIRDREDAFERALEARDVDAAVRAVLELDDSLASWASDTLQSDEQDRGRAALRRMVVRLGELARTGARPLRETIGPYVECLLSVRDAARRAGRYADGDGVRDQLVALGVAVRDTPTGTEWDPPLFQSGTPGAGGGSAGPETTANG